MLTETGRVVAVESGSVWVETIRQSTCGSCAAQKGCGHGLMNRISDKQRGFIRVLPGKTSPDECDIDDQVRISIPEEVILRGSLLVYAMPLVLLLAGAALAGALVPAGALAGSQDLAAVAGAVAGLVLGMGLVRLHAWRHRDDESLQPTLLEVVRPSTEALRLT